MRKLVLAIGLASMTSACGSFNLNEMLTSKAEKDAIDSLVQEAQYEYDKGRYDSALNLTNKALAINPNSESPTILKSYVYLSKAGLDAINISKKLIIANEATKTTAATTTTTSSSGTTAVKSGDTTTDNFNTLKSVMNLTETDFDAMSSSSATIGDSALKIYYPLSASLARDGKSESLAYLNEAIDTLCPLILSNANPETDEDTRHTCTKNSLASAAKGRANFAWALGHLGESIAFYSEILYDSNGDGVPNLQAAIPTGTLTANNAGTFISTVNAVNTALTAIFPTEAAAAAESMLNALFSDLKTASTALSAIPGVPTEVSDSVQKSIKDLDAKIATITKATTTTSAEGAQNEALKNSLTTGMATVLESKIESPQFSTLSSGDQLKACCVYRSMNAKAEMPTTCSAVTYKDAVCAAALAQ
ncbi:MAG: hypothetical protein H7318_16180 [Oligoflexus sp.]|nr:hypothetical protein [Oligoflexus sp.]